MAWNEGSPPVVNTGAVTLCQITDGTNVVLCGWLDDHWMFTNVNTLSVTHWQEWSPAAEPPEGEGWIPIDEFTPPDGIISLVEIYDGDSTSLTAWLGATIGRWLYEVPGATHAKLPTLDDPPAP